MAKYTYLFGDNTECTVSYPNDTIAVIESRMFATAKGHAIFLLCRGDCVDFHQVIASDIN